MSFSRPLSIERDLQGWERKSDETVFLLEVDGVVVQLYLDGSGSVSY